MDKQTPPEQPKSFSVLTFLKRVGISIFVIICLFGIWGTFFPGKSPKTEPQANTNAEQTKRYENKTYHYAVAYPGSFILSEETPYTTVFQKKKPQFGKVSFPTLYISVIPANFTGDENDIYNFMSTAMLDRFYQMNNAQSLSIAPQADPTYWTYTRLASIPLAGRTAIVIENNHVWEGEEGMRNRRILLRDKGNTYLIGSYYTAQEELTQLQQFVESFQLLE